MSCKGCQLLLDAGRVDIAAAVAEQLSWELPEKRLPESEALIRITTCQKCPFQVAGTCRKCGCYYTFRAYLKDKDCPMGYWDKRQPSIL